MIKPPHILTAAEAAQYLGFSVWWLKDQRRKGTGPAYIRCDRAIRYRVTDLDAWLEQHLVRTRDSAS